MPQKKKSKTVQAPANGFSTAPLSVVEEKERKVNDRRLKRQLADIYAEAQTAETDASILKPRPSRRKTKAVVALLCFFAFLTAISWTGFFLFGAGDKFSEKNITIKINGPEHAYAGQNITYRIHYGNRQSIALGRASLEARYPDHFKFISADPAPDDKENRVWNLGAIEQNKDGLIEINGQILGPSESDLTLRLFFNYKPANFNSDFQKIITFNTHLDPLPVDLSFTGPDQLAAGEEGTYQISLRNTNETALNNLELELTAPATLKILSAEPKPSADHNIWKFPVFDTQASGTIKIKAIFSAETLNGPQTIFARLKLREGGNLFPQQSVEKITKVIQSVLSLQLAANGSSDKQGVNFEDKINFALTYENTGETALKNVSLRLLLDTPSESEKSLLNWNALEEKYNGVVKGEQRSADIRRGIIVWTKAQIPALKEMKPGDKGVLELTIPLKAKTDLAATKLKEYKIEALAEATADFSGNQPVSVQSNPVILILNTDLNLSIQAALKEKKNLPTQISQASYDAEATYTVTWTLTNSLHEATDLQLTATLPENVDWKNKTSVSAGEVSFDETTKQVSWRLNRLPVSAPPTVVSFEVGVKYSDDDIGKAGMITDKTRVEAKDKITGENILFWKDPVMTIL